MLYALYIALRISSSSSCPQGVHSLVEKKHCYWQGSLFEWFVGRRLEWSWPSGREEGGKETSPWEDGIFPERQVREESCWIRWASSKRTFAWANLVYSWSHQYIPHISDSAQWRAEFSNCQSFPNLDKALFGVSKFLVQNVCMTNLVQSYSSASYLFSCHAHIEHGNISMTHWGNKQRHSFPRAEWSIPHSLFMLSWHKKLRYPLIWRIFK